MGCRVAYVEDLGFEKESDGLGKIRMDNPRWAAQETYAQCYARTTLPVMRHCVAGLFPV